MGDLHCFERKLYKMQNRNGYCGDGQAKTGTHRRGQFGFGAKGHGIPSAHKARRSTTLKKDDGTLILGGETSHIHRNTPWKQKWKLMKDGDLWAAFWMFWTS